jgi:hypothetical protein
VGRQSVLSENLPKMEGERLIMEREGELYQLLLCVELELEE